MTRWGRWAFLGYLVALGASNSVRALRPHQPAPAGDETAARVAVAGEAPVTIAYRTIGVRRTDQLPVILVHGSPGDNGEMRPIGRAMAPRLSIAPDLPGFGGSSWTVPDYSVVAHSRYVLALMDSLRVRRAHLVGFSMGGGVAIAMAARAPERVASVTLLSAIGVQEYELLGDYQLNHAIHGLQLAGLWLLREAVPHFGLGDGGMMTVEYARNFYDTDQRPLRAMLTTLTTPTLVLQGDKDFLVDPAVARETHRLVPQSELVLYTDQAADHFMAFERPDSLARVMTDFWGRVEGGRAATRATASTARLAAAAQPFDRRTIPAVVGVALAVLLLLLAAATFVSEDLTCIAAGLLVARGTLGFLAASTACFVGIVLGDLWLFLMGRWLGRPAIRRAPLRWFVSEAQVDRSATWFAKRGAGLILATRFIPGTRLPTYLAAGALHRQVGAFLGAFLLAAALWTPLLVGASAVFGDRVLAAFTSYQTLALPTILVLAGALGVVVKVLIPLLSWRGRRLLLSRWRRLTRWEFWPRWAFYPPIVLYVVWLAMKHRRLTLFTAVNPAIPGGGFVGESKAQILQGLMGSPDRVARWSYLERGVTATRFQRVLDIQRDWGTGFPVVLKPDVGERGGGVAIARSDEEVRRYLNRTAEPLLVQEYVPGVEIGVFYYRLPGDARGRIFAITEKRFPSVTGDGRSSLERLILGDERAVCMARFLLERHAERLDWIPGAGEVVPLVELGTHSRGAAFYDGEWIRTPALEAAIDELSQGFEGFWFGRYDLKGPSVEALQAGNHWKVLELNGATAEATSIYDPKHSLVDAYRILGRQWAILYTIAARNVAAGAQPASLRELLRLVDEYRRAVQAHVSA